MRVLLDTHTLIWSVFSQPQLSERAKQILLDGEATKFVSAATAWEIATKVRLGKMEEARVLFEEFEQTLQIAGYVPLPVTVEHALRAGSLAAVHKDPFDRMLAAQALTENILVLSMDDALDAFGVRRVW